MNKFGAFRNSPWTGPQVVEVQGGADTATDTREVFGRSALIRYLSVLRRRKWVILGSIVVALLLGALTTLLMTPKYTASAMIEIQRESRNFTDVRGADNAEESNVDLEFYQTQYGLLEARSLAERVAIDLRLFDKADFFEMFGSDFTERWFEDGRVIPSASTRDARVTEAADLLLENVLIDPERMSRLVEINFTSPDPELAKQVVDAWGANFVRETLERRFGATEYARDFLEERLGQLRDRIDESERQLVTYAARENIVNLPGGAQPGGVDAPASSTERPLVVEDLAIYNRELARATAERVQAQSRLTSRGDLTLEALENPAIADLRARRAELAAEYSRMMVQFEPDYPPAIALKTQVEGLDQSITREEQRVRSTIQEAYRSSRERESDLQQRVDQLKGDMLDLRRRSIQYNIYQREVDTNRQLYDALLQRYKEIGVAGGVGVNNISIVDPAEVPDRPSSPKLPLNLLIALLAGAAIGLGIALLLDQIDEGIQDPSEVEELLGLALLGTIPRMTDESPDEALQDRKSAISEAYLSLQTRLAFATDHGIPRSLAITSSMPGEGKTTTSFALAQSLARGGRKTVLVDADMRSPSIHSLLGLANDAGLSNYLAGEDDVAKLISPAIQSNLHVLVAGPQPPSAGELLAGDRLERLVTELLRDFENVIIDAPPVMGLADAPLIGSRVEGLVFVIESHATKRGVAGVAVDRMLASNSQIFGVVLTKFDVKRAQDGYGYGYGYGYGAAVEGTERG